MTHTVYIALGANLGDRLANLETACRLMQPALRILARSPIYETPPWGYLDQPRFLNQVVQAETDLSPQDLLSFLKNLETLMGRVKNIQYGPRPIDLDVLFYDNLIMDTPNLTIPHPRIEGRSFVLLPLSNLAPDLQHPVLKKSIRELLAASDCRGIELFQP